MSEQAVDPKVAEYQSLVRESGASAVIARIRAEADPAERLRLFSLAQRAIGGGVKDCALDDVIDVVEAGIGEALAQSEQAPDEAARRKLVDTANVLSYNLASALADCWPDDARARQEHHLRTGLEAAEACLRWREELGKGPFPFSIAWWAKGIHLLALKRASEAEDAFARALKHAEAHLEAHGKSIARDATGDWSILLSEGYVQVARAARTGERDGIRAVLAALDAAAAARPGEADDLAFTASQLRCALERHAGP
jgi:hypothetical protein